MQLTVSNVNVINTISTSGGLSMNGLSITSYFTTFQSSVSAYRDGLVGRRYAGYFADDVNYFRAAPSEVTSNAALFTSISDFSSSPNNDNTVESYSWEWTGLFKPSEPGSWTFYTTSDDASYVWIGDTAVTGYSTTNALVNNGGLHGPLEASGSISLRSDTFYPIRIQFGENTGGDRMTFAFSGPNTNKTSYGQGYFFNSGVMVGMSEIKSNEIIVPKITLGGADFGGFAAGILYQGVVNTQIFTANGTWTKPTANASLGLTGDEQVLVMMWGGGGGALGGGANPGGGGGGACLVSTFPLSSATNTCSVTVGAGGTGSATAPTAGGSSVFVINASASMTAYGGGQGGAALGGGGGGTFGAGVVTTGGAPLGGTVPGTESTFGGGVGSNATITAGNSIFGGGGGSRTVQAGNSIYGGAGGYGSGVNAGRAFSYFGGNGGVTNSSLVIAAQAPGGGGGSNATASGFQNGARGEVRIWVLGRNKSQYVNGAPTYTLSSNLTSLLENSSVSYTLSTTDVADSTTFYYTLNNSSAATSADFSTAVNGSFTISSGVGSFTLTAIDDADAVNESFQMDVRTGSSTGTIVASNGSVSIVPRTLTITPQASGNVDTGAVTQTFNGVSVGTATSDRLVVVVFNSTASSAGGTATTDVTATINGSAMTRHVKSYSTVGTTESYTAIFSGLVTTGTTANIVFTGAASIGRCGFTVYSLTGYNSSTPTGTSVANGIVASPTTITNTITTSTGGIVVGGGSAFYASGLRGISSYSNTNVSGTSLSYTVTSANATVWNVSVTNMREDYDYTYVSSGTLNDCQAMAFVSWR